ncbi:MAG: cation-transporting P-type ATPase [Candidatus Saccharimonadales bacterium]
MDKHKPNGSASSVAYQRETAEVLSDFKSAQAGLSEAAAGKRLNQYGTNTLEVGKSDPAWLKYLRQYKDLMIGLLVISAALSFYLGDRRTSYVLLAIVLFNTTLGFLQEFKAERIMQALEKLVKPEAQVYRDGKLTQAESAQLVPGDIVHIAEGDWVPADLRLLEEQELSTNDFALTGESNPSRKFTHAIKGTVELSERHNLVFMGTTVATGEAHGIVIATGMHTELGRIANLSSNTPREVSPLQREMNNIATRITIGVVILCAALLPLILKSGNLTFKDAFLFAIGFASSLIPQGLPAEINTALAQAANKLAHAKALVKKLSAVETLGATHIICTDKTGTLTKNQMTVERVSIGHEIFLVEGSGYEAHGRITDPNGKALSNEQLNQFAYFFQCGAYASNARVLPPDSEHASWYCLGDPTEGALITLARKSGLDLEQLEAESPELREFTFDSVRKRMSSIRNVDGQLTVHVKGAPESVLKRCTHIFENGKTRKLTTSDRAWYQKQHEQLAGSAMRNLVYASKILKEAADPRTITMDEAESELTLLGMVSIVDPLREEVPDAMQAAHQAHIRVNVITGDFALTAEAIARKAGLAGKDEHLVVIPGNELKNMADAEIFKHVRAGGTIFSRVSPEDKMRIVEIVRQAQEIIAVTGDGINDAPALKRADIGVAMGVTGTDVAKQSAEIVLLDDSFHTLVRAVQAGRTIFANIKKGTLSCFTSNTAELFTNLASLGALSLFGIPLAIGVMQILAIDLVAELFPIAALGWDPAEGELMSEKPRDPKQHILNRRSIVDLLWCGLIIGSLAFTNYLLFFHRAGMQPRSADTNSLPYLQATTVTYLTIVCCQLINIMQRRSIKGFFSRYQFTNWHFWAAIALSLSCVMAIIYSPINQYFKTGPLGIVDWLYALGAAAIFLAIREVQRLIKK